MKKLLFSFCVLMVTACSKRDGAQADSAAATQQAATAPAASPNTNAPAPSRQANPPCPHTGKWAPCSVERRLRQSGFVIKRIPGEAPKRAGFSVQPIVYSLGASRIEVFLYDDSAGVARDVTALDTVSVAPRGSRSVWENPVFIRSGNLAAVLTSQNPRQVERVILAITAGAPQPGSSR